MTSGGPDRPHQEPGTRNREPADQGGSKHSQVGLISKALNVSKGSTGHMIRLSIQKENTEIDLPFCCAWSVLRWPLSFLAVSQLLGKLSTLGLLSGSLTVETVKTSADQQSSGDLPAMMPSSPAYGSYIAQSPIATGLFVMHNDQKRTSDLNAS